jgi:hypothetical protein
MTTYIPYNDPENANVEWQDLSYAPPRYLLPEPGLTGAWSVLRNSDGAAIAIAYSDYNQAAGIMWIQQPDEVTRVDQFFQTMRAANVPAGPAYDSAIRLPDVTFDEEQYGDLAGALELYNGMLANPPALPEGG